MMKLFGALAAVVDDSGMVAATGGGRGGVTMALESS